MTLRNTYTIATLELSRTAYEEIAAKLREAGYDHAFDGGLIDMTGIGVLPSKTEDVPTPSYDENSVEDMRQRKDNAYWERNCVVALLARIALRLGAPAGVNKTDIPGWSTDWHSCVYVDLPTGQVSWHYHDSHAYLFNGLPKYEGTWDGHDTPEKYRRVKSAFQPPMVGGSVPVFKAKLDALVLEAGKAGHYAAYHPLDHSKNRNTPEYIGLKESYDRIYHDTLNYFKGWANDDGQ